MLDQSQCLLAALLENHEQWLPWGDTAIFWDYLWGANYRANLTDVHFPNWRIFGPIEQSDFFDHYFGNEHLSGQLHYTSSDVLQRWEQTDVRTPRFEACLQQWFGQDLVQNELIHRAQMVIFLSAFASRPNMFRKQVTSQSIYACLVGMKHGGDWLGLPEHHDTVRVLNVVESESLERTGSPFELYKKYRNEPSIITELIIREIGAMPTIGSTTTR